MELVIEKSEEKEKIKFINDSVDKESIIILFSSERLKGIKNSILTLLNYINNLETVFESFTYDVDLTPEKEEAEKSKLYMTLSITEYSSIMLRIKCSMFMIKSRVRREMEIESDNDVIEILDKMLKSINKYENKLKVKDDKKKLEQKFKSLKYFFGKVNYNNSHPKIGFELSVSNDNEIVFDKTDLIEKGNLAIFLFEFEPLTFEELNEVIEIYNENKNASSAEEYKNALEAFSNFKEKVFRFLLNKSCHVFSDKMTEERLQSYILGKKWETRELEYRAIIQNLAIEMDVVFDVYSVQLRRKIYTKAEIIINEESSSKEIYRMQEDLKEKLKLKEMKKIDDQKREKQLLKLEKYKTMFIESKPLNNNIKKIHTFIEEETTNNIDENNRICYFSHPFDIKTGNVDIKKEIKRISNFTRRRVESLDEGESLLPVKKLSAKSMKNSRKSDFNSSDSMDESDTSESSNESIASDSSDEFVNLSRDKALMSKNKSIKDSNLEDSSNVDKDYLTFQKSLLSRKLKDKKITYDSSSDSSVTDSKITKSSVKRSTEKQTQKKPPIKYYSSSGSDSDSD